MSERANATAREWQMTRLSAGAYLLPSNDRSMVFLITRYTEDGTAEDAAGRPLLGTYWQVATMTLAAAEREHLHTDPDPLLWGGWEPVASMEPTRRDAIDAAMMWTAP